MGTQYVVLWHVNVLMLVLALVIAAACGRRSWVPQQSRLDGGTSRQSESAVKRQPAPPALSGLDLKAFGFVPAALHDSSIAGI
jgi:hypothetical protein